MVLASRALGELRAEAVPGGLRPFARFKPDRRVRLAAGALATAVADDATFRDHVGERLRREARDLTEAIARGRVPAAADPVEVAAAAYLLRPEGWPEIVARAAEHLAHARATQAADRESEVVAKLRDELAQAQEATRGAVREEKERTREELNRLKAENARLRRTLHDARVQARESSTAAASQEAAAAQARDYAAAQADRSAIELRRQRGRVSELEAALERARRSDRDRRDLATVRLRLLVDTLVDSAQGLRRELALPPAQEMPADLLEEDEVGSGGGSDAGSGRGAGSPRDDPTYLRMLLERPHCHLVVDGYNVTKTAWARMPLEAQRLRLIGGLGSLVSRSGTEVTCVFDGAELDSPPPVTAPRGVRVRFSPAGTTADEVIGRLVAAEPAGRPTVVISSDREVAEGARRSGAQALAALTLVRLLGS